MGTALWRVDCIMGPLYDPYGIYNNSIIADMFNISGVK